MKGKGPPSRILDHAGVQVVIESQAFGLKFFAIGQHDPGRLPRRSCHVPGRQHDAVGADHNAAALPLSDLHADDARRNFFKYGMDLLFDGSQVLDIAWHRLHHGRQFLALGSRRLTSDQDKSESQQRQAENRTNHSPNLS